MFLEDKTLNPGVKVDPFSLEALIAWLETKPATEEYSYYGECLFEQYGEYCGFGTGAHAFNVVTDRGEWIDLTGQSEGRLAAPEPHTFGAALSRARNLLSERNR